MSKITIDSTLYLKLYKLMYGDWDEKETGWKPTKEVFRELLNNYDNYSGIWFPIRKLPKSFNGIVIAKVIYMGHPRLMNLWIDNGSISNINEFDCVVSYLVTKDAFERIFEGRRKKVRKSISSEMIHDMISEVLNENENKTEFTEYCTLYNGVQLNDWTTKDTNDRFLKGIIAKNKKENIEVIYNTFNRNL